MRCPRCKAFSSEGASFCEECGARLERACPSCGAPAGSAAKFCRSCGAPLQTDDRAPAAFTPSHLATKILASRAALEGERKQVTALFADLRRSMELLEELDPEEARRLMDPAVQMMMDAVHRYEGTVNHVLGDGIMALFGAPIAHEDAPQRALYAALAIRDSVASYGEQVRRESGAVIQVRVGVNSGEVVVRSIGSDLRLDYSAVGHAVGLAARMESLAKPDSILVTEATYALSEDYFRWSPLGPIAVKGSSRPIEAYEPLGPSEVKTRLQAGARRGLTPFVGRVREMNHLKETLEAAKRGQGQVVAVVGEPAVGKSRLFYELTHSQRTLGCLVVESGSVSYGKATAYLPVIDLLRAYFQIENLDDARKIREKVTGKLLNLDPALGATLPAFLGLLDVPVEEPAWQALDPSQRRQRTLNAIKRLLLRESHVQPLLLVFEDLHWIDGETQALLDSLVEGLPTARILLLVNYRPEYEHRWGSKSYYTQLRLDPLPPESARELLHGLLGDDARIEPLKLVLIERTEGNPFFLEESVRNLVETGVVAGERGAYRLTNALPDVQVPATVQAILAARIDRLPPEEKRLLQSAAVVGKDVPFALLAAIADESEEDLRLGLTHLQAAEFIYETSLLPDLEYTFKHALTHEVAYGSLLQERRRALHARIMEAIEQLYPDRLAEQVDRLAHHAVRGEVWDKAVAYLRQAVARAMARSAQREAAAHVDQALKVLEHLPESRGKLELAIDLRFGLRNALWPLGEMDRILATLNEAEALSQELGDPRRMGLTCAYLCTSYYGAAEHDRAVAAGERALAHSMSLDAVDLRALAGSNLGQAYVARTDYRRATEVLSKTVAFLVGELLHERFAEGTVPSVLSRVNLVRGLVELGRFPEAIARSMEAIRIAEAVDHPASLLLAHVACGLTRLRQGDSARAIASLEHSVGIGREMELSTFLHWSGPFLGAAYALAGRPSEALALLEQVLEQDVSTNLMSQNTLTVAYLAEAHLLAGHVQDSTEHAARALTLSRERNERGYQAWIHRLLGEIASRHEPPDLGAAAASYQKALRLAEELGMRPLAAHCHLGLGRLERQTADRQAAEERLSRAATMYREMEMSFWLAQAEAELATSDGAPGSGS